MEEKLRRTGRSTRLIDEYIQKLFTFKAVRIVDHIDQHELNQELQRRIKKRLALEHPSIEYLTFLEDPELLIIRFKEASKYRTPSIEEFVDGFEYQHLCRPPKGEWCTYTYTYSSDGYLQYIKENLEKGKIRVKINGRR